MKLNLAEALNQALFKEMEINDRILILGQDVGVDGGVFRITEGLLEKFGESRVIDTPLAESGIVGAAIGMAAYGLCPVAEIQFMGFVYSAFNQILAHAARLRNRSRGRYSVPIVIRMPYGGGVKALEHHSESTEAFFCHIPGIKVVVPSTPYDAKGLLISAIRDDDPVVFLEPKKLYRTGKQEVPEEAYHVPIGEAKVAREGEDLTIITWGGMVPVVQSAADLVEENDRVFPEVIDVRTLSPMDYRTIIASIKKTGRGIIVHEAPRTCGMGAEIAALISEKALVSLKAPIVRVTGHDITVPLSESEDYYFPTPERIYLNIKKIMEW